LHQADVVFALAKDAEALAIAPAPLFRLVALHANVSVGHTADFIANLAGRKASSSRLGRLLTTASGCYL
jgi:hypothetical protein